VGAVPQRRHLVYLALARPRSGGVLE
jgi:hypothetical protein